MLLVDDARTLRFTLGTLLVQAGYTFDGVDSLGAARERLAAGNDYQAVILDRYLSDGGGLDLVPEIRRLLPGARIILLTGLPEERVEANLVDAVVAKTQPLESWIAQLQPRKADEKANSARAGT